ncbi:hypothetical protein ACIQU5_35090 [Streptomyces sp. NPDC090306]|uniref:hypothetical protein n=1 Tax=Streptomyces sp. NPDC090306 TaxID=3365961 RepID=UPI0037FFFF67
MQALSNDELLHEETEWIRDFALRTHQYALAFPDHSDVERREVRLAVLHAWIRYRYPLNLQYVTNYAATVVTALGMAAVTAVAGATAAVFARDGGDSAGAPWWLYPTAIWAALCLGALLAAREDLRGIVAVIGDLGLGGMLRSMTRPQIAYWFVPATVLITVLVGVAASWLAVGTALSVPPGRQSISAAAGLFGLILGLQSNRWISTVEGLLNRRYQQPHRPRPLDAVLVHLAAATSACFQGRARWWEAENIRLVRAQLATATAAAHDVTTVRRRTTLTEVAARRQARQFRAALAELVRRHDRAITRVHTAQEYDAVTSSLRSGVLALVAGDLASLMEHSSAEPPTSRAARLLRRTGSSLALVAFALVIPLLPGVDGATADGVRVLLLMTAALALTPASDSASSSVRSALERSLFAKGGGGS